MSATNILCFRLGWEARSRLPSAFPLHLAESWGSTQSQLPAGPFPRGCALGRAPCSPWGCLQAVCEPWVPGITPRCQAGHGTAAWPGGSLNLPPAQQGTRDDPSFASVLWGSALFGAQPLVWGSALGVSAAPCSSSRVWGGLRGGILGHAARGGCLSRALEAPCQTPGSLCQQSLGHWDHPCSLRQGLL